MANKTPKNKPEVDHSGHRQRLKARFMNEGLENFAERNVLELLLFYGIPYRDTEDTAIQLLDEFGTIESVFEADPEDLVKIPKVGDNVVVLLKLIPEISKYFLALKYKDKKSFDGVSDVAQFLIDQYVLEEREVFSVLCLDSQLKLLGYKKFPSGTAASTGIDTQKLVEFAIKKNSARVIFAHNHPGGSLEPSMNDLSTTSLLCDTFKKINIEVLDHIIVTREGYTSMAGIKKYSSLFK